MIFPQSPRAHADPPPAAILAHAAKAVEALARKFLSRPRSADEEDAMQEALVSLYNAIVRGVAVNEAAFFYRALSNRLIDLRRREERLQQHLEIFAYVHHFAPDLPLDRWEEADSLADAIALLPPEDQAVARAFLETGSCRAVAKRFGVGSNTAIAHVRKIANRLRVLCGHEIF